MAAPVKAKIVLVAPAPAPYRAFFYDELVRRLPEYEFLAIFQGENRSSTWASDRPMLMKSEVLRPIPLGPLEQLPSVQLVNAGFPRILDSVLPDVVVTHAFGTPTGRAIAKWAWRHKAPLFLRCDTNFTREMEKPLWKRRLRGLSYRKEMRGAFGALSIGTLNEAFYSYRGLGTERQHRVPFLIDSSKVAELAEGERVSGRLRLQLGLQSRRVILFVGRLAPEKGVDDLLDAFAMVANSLPDVHLLLIGTGPLEVSLKSRAGALLGTRIHMPGFFEPQDVWRALGLADVLAVPSLREPWGLVMNEAMAAGVPVVTTPSFGAAKDLLRNGINGTLVPTNDDAALATCLTNLLGDAIALRQMGQEAERTYARWTSVHDPIAGMSLAIEAALRSRAR